MTRPPSNLFINLLFALAGRNWNGQFNTSFWAKWLIPRRELKTTYEQIDVNYTSTRPLNPDDQNVRRNLVKNELKNLHCEASNHEIVHSTNREEKRRGNDFHWIAINIPRIPQIYFWRDFTERRFFFKMIDETRHILAPTWIKVSRTMNKSFTKKMTKFYLIKLSAYEFWRSSYFFHRCWTKNKSLKSAVNPYFQLDGYTTAEEIHSTTVPRLFPDMLQKRSDGLNGLLRISGLHYVEEVSQQFVRYEDRASPQQLDKPWTQLGRSGTGSRDDQVRWPTGKKSGRVELGE